MKALVLGSGAWGTALSLLLCRREQETLLWNRDPEKAARMRRRRVNPRLPGVTLPRTLGFTADPAALAEAELAVFAVPSYAVRETARLAKAHLRPGTLLVSAAKGVEPETCLRMTQVIRSELGEGFPLAALSGPSHAEEVALCMPTGCVAAGEEDAALRVQQAFTTRDDQLAIADNSKSFLGIEAGKRPFQRASSQRRAAIVGYLQLSVDASTESETVGIADQQRHHGRAELSPLLFRTYVLRVEESIENAHIGRALAGIVLQIEQLEACHSGCS